MKRRSFLSVIAGVVVAPIAAHVPVMAAVVDKAVQLGGAELLRDGDTFTMAGVLDRTGKPSVFKVISMA